jgi:hypothetical protein
MYIQNDPILAPQYTVFGRALSTMRLHLGDLSPKKVKTLARTTPLSVAEKAQSVIKEAIEQMPTNMLYLIPTTKNEGERPDSICQGFGMPLLHVMWSLELMGFRTK